MKLMKNSVRGYWTTGRHLVNHHWVWSGTFFGLLDIGLLARFNETFAGWLSHQNAPAWVQAVGSVIAILAAISIANSQVKHQQQEQVKRDRAAAAVIARGTSAQNAALTRAFDELAKATSEGAVASTFMTRTHIDRLNEAARPSNDDLLLLAAAIPVATVAYIDAFEMRDIVLKVLQNFGSIHVLNVDLSPAQRVPLQMLAKNGINNCRITAAGVMSLFSEEHRVVQREMLAAFAANDQG